MSPLEGVNREAIGGDFSSWGLGMNVWNVSGHSIKFYNLIKIF